MLAIVLTQSCLPESNGTSDVKSEDTVSILVGIKRYRYLSNGTDEASIPS